MQFTKAETRMAILEAMGWWFAERPPRQPTAPQQPATCAAIASGAAASAAPLDGVVVSSALANFSLLCLLPGPRDGQRVVLGVEPRPDGALANCPRRCMYVDPHRPQASDPPPTGFGHRALPPWYVPPAPDPAQGWPDAAHGLLPRPASAS